MEIMHTVFLSIGSNQGDRFLFLENAVEAIKAHIGLKIEVSPIYESEPIGFDSDELFLNACVKVETKKKPLEILSIIQSIEQKNGRIRTENQKYTSRTLDIDILFYDQEIISTENLKIPHPHFGERKFVLLPLLNLQRDFKDPVSRKTIQKIYDNCKDVSVLNRVDRHFFD
jgi:deoxyguanosine kinase